MDLVRQLPQGGSQKDDLQAIYEAVQEITSVQFDMARPLDNLAYAIAEVKKLILEHDSSGRRADLDHDLGVDKATKQIQNCLDDVEANLAEATQERRSLGVMLADIEEAIKEIQASLPTHEPSPDMRILLQAAQQILLDHGFTETGVKEKRSEVAFTKVVGVIRTKALETIVSALLLWGFYWGARLILWTPPPTPQTQTQVQIPQK